MKLNRWLPLAIFAAIAVLLAAGVWLSRKPDRESLPSALIGKPAPEFSLPVLHEPGRLVSSQELRGAPYVLNVWGSWCPGCRIEHPVISRFAETKRVRVIGYNWKDDHADALRWLEQFNNPYWLVLVDYDGRTAIDWGITARPRPSSSTAAASSAGSTACPMTDEVVQNELLPALAAVEAEAAAK